LGTNTPVALGNAALFIQPDQYKLEIIQADGEPLGGVTWAGAMAGAYTRVFTTHLEEEAYTFDLPAGINPEGLKLRVSSRLTPDVGHEVGLAPCATPPIGVWPLANMVWIPCGTFMMGSPEGEPDIPSLARPQTLVAISRGFWMGKYEVTQGEYLDMMGSNPSWYNGDKMIYDWFPMDYGTNLSRPVDSVSWDDAMAYCTVLTERERSAERLPTGYEYRLPTEAEWEYACRAGTTTAFCYGDELQHGMANFDSGSWGAPDYPSFPIGQTEAVGSYAPNAWGLYDMHGNVQEWCLDWAGLLPGGSVSDLRGPSAGNYPGVRGGNFYLPSISCRSAARSQRQRSNNEFIGFRLVLAPSQP
jgi:formylglycine-generating enzyme required for sulfatase activity